MINNERKFDISFPEKTCEINEKNLHSSESLPIKEETLSLEEKIQNKIKELLQDRSPENSSLSMLIRIAMMQIENLQKNSEIFPAIETIPCSLIAASKTIAYIAITEIPMVEGNQKKIYKIIKVDKSQKKAKARALLIIKNIKKFKEKGLQIDHLDFESSYVIPKSEFRYNQNTQIALIKPLYEGSLMDIISWEFSQKIEVVKQAALGILAFHENGYIHRDIKPGNFLYKIKISKNNKDLRVVLSDEDSAIKFDDPKKLTHPVWTPGYIVKDSFTSPSPASDMYAFGVSLQEIFPQLYLKSFSILSTTELELMNLIDGLKASDPLERPTAKQTLQKLEQILTNIKIHDI